MTTNTKVTCDSHVGGVRSRWHKKHAYGVNKYAHRRLKKNSGILKRVDVSALYDFPPAPPSNTTQFLMDRIANEQPETLATSNDSNDSDFSYGSMDMFMNSSTTLSCRLNVVSEFLESNLNKFQCIDIA